MRLLCQAHRINGKGSHRSCGFVLYRKSAQKIRTKKVATVCSSNLRLESWDNLWLSHGLHTQCDHHPKKTKRLSPSPVRYLVELSAKEGWREARESLTRYEPSVTNEKVQKKSAQNNSLNIRQILGKKRHLKQQQTYRRWNEINSLGRHELAQYLLSRHWFSCWNGDLFFAVIRFG